MSYRQFPQINKLKIISASGEHVGSFQVASAISLKHIVLNAYIKGAAGASAKMKLHLYGSTNYDAPLVSSEWVTLADIDGFNGGNWIGFLRFDFTGHPLNPNYYYQMKLETYGYTRNANTHYISLALDYAVPLSNLVSANDIGLHMSVIGAA